MKITSNQNVSFQAKLNYSFLPNQEKWKDIGKIFQNQTTDIKDYELLLLKNEKSKNELVLATFNKENNTQSFNILGKNGTDKLNQLSPEEIAGKLVKFLKQFVKKDQDEKLELDKYLSKYNDPNVVDDEKLEKFYKQISRKLNKKVIHNLNEDNVFENELKIDVNPIRIFKDHFAEFKQ